MSNIEQLTPQEKGRITREKNKAARAEAKAAWEAEKKREKDATIKVMCAIRDDPNATAAQKIFAVSVLDHLLPGHIMLPYGLEYHESAGRFPCPLDDTLSSSSVQ